MNLVQGEVNDLLANRVVPRAIVIGSIFLAWDELLRVEELVVGAGTNFINDGGLRVYKHCPTNTCLNERVISSPSGVTWHLAIRLDTCSRQWSSQ